MQCWNFCLTVRVCVCNFNCSVVSNALQPFGLFHGASCLFQVILVLKQGNIHQNGVVLFRPQLLGLCLCYKTLFYNN